MFSSRRPIQKPVKSNFTSYESGGLGLSARFLDRSHGRRRPSTPFSVFAFVVVIWVTTFGFACGGGGGGDPSCDDFNQCTNDVLLPDGSCLHSSILSNACRPNIEVSYPARAATIAGTRDRRSLTVTGTVTSPSGSISELLLNDSVVTVEADGSFSHSIAPQVGGNTLVFTAKDALGLVRRRVQSFLWSTEFIKPTSPNEGISSQAIGLWLSEQAMDDGDDAAPPNDLAGVINLALASTDSNLDVDPNTPLTTVAGYDVYLRSLALGDRAVRLSPVDGGLRTKLIITDIEGILFLDCREPSCALIGSGTGGFVVANVEVEATTLVSVDTQGGTERTLNISVQDAQTTIDREGVNLFADNAELDAALSVFEALVLDLVVANIDSLVSASLENLVSPILEQSLRTFALNLNVDFPSLLANGSTLSIQLVSDFDDVDFQDGQTPPEPSPPAGGQINFRGGAYPTQSVNPYDNLGFPLHDNCGAGGFKLELPRSSLVAFGVSDDFLNQVLFAAWRSGLLELDFPPELLSDLPLPGITVMSMRVSGRLAPTISDCGVTSNAEVYLGDLQLDAELLFNGSPFTLTSFTSLGGEIELSVTPDGIGIGLGRVTRVDTELTVDQDPQLAFEELLNSFLEVALRQVVNDLRGEGLGVIPLPEIDLSADFGLPPGAGTMTINPLSVEHTNGAAVIRGTLENRTP